ncbi:MAG TPA: PilZ domain-containing protein [Caulobacterales bacterium]|nr:PilZ domain-containing protein [Caulobacterales bacterium]
MVAFESAAQSLAPPRSRERRRFYRAPIVVGGRMLDPLGREHDCRTADLSPGDARLAAPIALDVGQRVVLYLDGFGRVAGHVVRACGENEFAIVFDISAHKREKLAEALIWIMNKAPLGLDEDTPKFALRQGLHYARIETDDGEIIDGEVLDFSLAGMTIRSPQPPPPLGVWVRVGGAYGRVARRIDGGFAVDFEPRGGNSSHN